MVYRMIFNQTAYFGRGAIKEIPGVAKSHGFTKAFIVTDPVLLETGTVKKVTDVLDEAGMPYEVFDNVKPNPPVECIQDGVAKFAASGADFLIGLGGGSPQDTCKGIGIITANPEFADVLSLEGVADTKNPSVPIFGVPTSVGYGAAQGGRAALASMLSSCAPGVGIMNIDNGYGAACAAARVVNGL